MKKRAKLILLAIVGSLLVLYVGPVCWILFVPARGLTPEVQYRPSTLQVQELGLNRSGILLRAEGAAVWNEPFPYEVRGTPWTPPPTPGPRIRTAISDYRDRYSTMLTAIYFPVIMLAGGGPVLFGICGIAALSATFKPLIAWRKITGSLTWVALLITLVAVTCLLAIWPRALRQYYGKHRALIWEDSPLTHYLEGGFSVDPEAPDQPMRTRLVVVNGRPSSTELYADGFMVDIVPSKGIRAYRRLRSFSRLTAIDVSTQSVVEDFYFHDSGEDKGILIYNVCGADSFRIEGPPKYTLVR